MGLNKTILSSGITVLFLVLLFGCTAPTQTDKEALSKLGVLEQKYFVVNGYSSSITTMNDYISELSLLRSKSSGESARIIEAELYSAETFYYLNKTIIDSAPINSKQIKCSSNEVQEIISSVTLAFDYSTKAINSINSLSEEAKKSLRENQLQIVLGQQEEINQIKNFFEEKC
ncbi:MAG: hypothetical protein WCW44_06435 [archaeon]|jgi:hypothetical protein